MYILACKDCLLYIYSFLDNKESLCFVADDLTVFFHERGPFEINK